jgi:hypothetical protein
MSIASIDLAERTQIYREVRPGILVELPWDKITIDGVMYYEPGVSSDGWTSSFQRQKGVSIAQEVFTHPAPAVPIPVRPTNGQYAIWQYGGI